MNLPNYFLADLSKEASLSPSLITEACQTLKRNRDQYLLGRSTASLVRSVAELAAEWLNPEFSFRQLALSAGSELTGFPPATLSAGLDAFFGRLTVENIEQLLLQ